MTDPAVSEGTVHVLKRDLFGQIARVDLSVDGRPLSAIARDTRVAKWWVRPLARALARREQRALAALRDVDQVPKPLVLPPDVQLADGVDAAQLRTWLPGEAMQHAQPSDPDYFFQALCLVGRMHRAGVTHNDLAKEPNWLVGPNGEARLVDFQLAGVHRKRNARFKLQAREDLRHLLKHKRTYCPEALTPRELEILSTPSGVARWWRRVVKPVYTFVTRKLLRWQDREGAGDRGGLR